jgi:hypothetical protein
MLLSWFNTRDGFGAGRGRLNVLIGRGVPRFGADIRFVSSLQTASRRLAGLAGEAR